MVRSILERLLFIKNSVWKRKAKKKEVKTGFKHPESIIEIVTSDFIFRVQLKLFKVTKRKFIESVTMIIRFAKFRNSVLLSLVVFRIKNNPKIVRVERI